jgi:hypothetical protein
MRRLRSVIASRLTRFGDELWSKPTASTAGACRPWLLPHASESLGCCVEYAPTPQGRGAGS